jgi:hypothetical protein
VLTGAMAGVAGYLLAVLADVSVALVVIVVLAVTASAGFVAGRAPRSARLVAFTADGWVWLVELGRSYEPGEVLVRAPLSAWRPRRAARGRLEAEVAEQQVVLPGLGWKDQLPDRPES